MARKHMGRHRAPNYSPLNELAGMAAQSAQPAMKVSAVAVASGGLLATFALPASAAPVARGTSISTVGETAALVSAPQLATTVSAVAVAAPAKPANAPTFGMTGFSSSAAAPAKAPMMMIAKVKKAVVAPVVTTTRSTRSVTSTRSTTRSSSSAAATTQTTAAVSAPAAAPSGGILGAAAALSGIPYVYGGMSRGGADCSGYTSLVFAAIGRSIPRTAEAQRQAATPVSNPVPGDLIFFGFPAYHVGIFAGNGMMYDNQHPGTTSGLHSIWTMRNVSFGRI